VGEVAGGAASAEAAAPVTA